MRKLMMTVIASAVPMAASAQVALVRPSPIQAIGPKQDDPRACPAEAIGPKQDDPRTGGIAVGSYNPETDPHANGSGAEMIGPKHDDPRQGIIVQGGRALAIGPKHDDPRTGGVAVGSYNPDTDPHAASAGSCVKKKKD